MNQYFANETQINKLDNYLNLKAHWKLFKNYEKGFLFRLKGSFRSQDI